MLLYPSVHMPLAKKRSMNELYLLKHSVFMQLPRYQEDVFIVLFRLKKKYIFKKNQCIPGQMSTNTLTIA